MNNYDSASVGIKSDSIRTITTTLLESIERIARLIDVEREVEQLLSVIQDTNKDNIKSPEISNKDINGNTSIFELIVHLNILTVRLSDIKESNLNHLMVITRK